MWVQVYTCYLVEMGIKQNILTPVEFEYEDEDIVFSLGMGMG